MRKRVVFCMITIAWLVSSIIGLLRLIVITSKSETLLQSDIAQEYYQGKTNFCYISKFYLIPEGYDYHIPVGQSTVYLAEEYLDISLVIIVCLVMTFVYVYIAYVVIRVTRRQEQRMRNSTITSQERRSRFRQSRSKGLCTTALLLGTFAAVWLPMHIVKVLLASGSSVVESITAKDYSILRIVATTTTVLDVVIYFLRSRELSVLMVQLKQRCSCTTVRSPNTSSHMAGVGSKLTTHTNV